MSERLTEAQRDLLCAMASGWTLEADILAGFPTLREGRDHRWPRQQTVAACERRGWVMRGKEVNGNEGFRRFLYAITDAGRRALQGDQQ